MQNGGMEQPGSISNWALPSRHCAPEAGPGNEKVPHGTHCECLVLAAAIGARPDSIPFDYCLNVLRKHWRMTCRHGEILETRKEKEASEKWRNLGEMDAVKAILISNG
mgnify:CR=1 FL=1